jgi:hypothetical protein
VPSVLMSVCPPMVRYELQSVRCCSDSAPCADGARGRPSTCCV